MTLHLAGSWGDVKFLHGARLQPREADGQNVLARKRCRIITFREIYLFGVIFQEQLDLRVIFQEQLDRFCSNWDDYRGLGVETKHIQISRTTVFSVRSRKAIYLLFHLSPTYLAWSCL